MAVPGRTWKGSGFSVKYDFFKKNSCSKLLHPSSSFPYKGAQQMFPNIGISNFIKNASIFSLWNFLEPKALIQKYSVFLGGKRVTSCILLITKKAFDIIFQTIFLKNKINKSWLTPIPFAIQAFWCSL